MKVGITNRSIARKENMAKRARSRPSCIMALPAEGEGKFKKNKTRAKTHTHTIGHLCCGSLSFFELRFVSFFSLFYSFSLSMFFLLATLTFAPLGHSNILPLSNFSFLVHCSCSALSRSPSLVCLAPNNYWAPKLGELQPARPIA